MSKNISVSDDVYEALKQRKRGRSFSETIREAMDAGGGLSDVVGQGIFPEGSLAEVKEEIEDLSEGTMDRLDEGGDDEAR